MDTDFIREKFLLSIHFFLFRPYVEQKSSLRTLSRETILSMRGDHMKILIYHHYDNDGVRREVLLIIP